MKKFLIFLGIIAVVAVALMATTPDRQQHVDTIKSVMRDLLTPNYAKTILMVRWDL